MLCDSLGGSEFGGEWVQESGYRESGYDWVPLLLTWNHHNIVCKSAIPQDKKFNKNKYIKKGKRRKHCQTQYRVAFALLSSSFIDFTLKFTCLISFELTFVYGIKWGSNFIIPRIFMALLPVSVSTLAITQASHSLTAHVDASTQAAVCTWGREPWGGAVVSCDSRWPINLH